MTSHIEALETAKRLMDEKELDEAYKIVEEVLLDDPNHGLALYMAAHIMEMAGKVAVAYTFARRSADVSPEKPMTWEMVGKTAEVLSRFDEAEKAYRKAIQLSATDNGRAGNYSNLGALYINSGRFKEAQRPCEEALKLTPLSRKARGNYGLSLLGQRKWAGWDFFSALWGTEYRPRNRYCNEPDWEGESGQKIVVYGEQGLGDEICFASMIPDVAKDCTVILDCDIKLSNLFERSFPNVKVYGTRRDKGLLWDEKDREGIEASISIGELGRFYRVKNSQFTGAPYLVADPVRKTMWRALFDSKKKPVIGIAWTGGTLKTNGKSRKLKLSSLLPILKAIDAHWVSLEYKDAFREVQEMKALGVDIEQYGFATLTPDYDDTAALVDSCDFVICMQTAVAHLAGALGKECWVMVPKCSGWRYGEEGDTTPWYSSLKLIRQKDFGSWVGPINKIVKMLHAYSDHQSNHRQAASADCPVLQGGKRGIPERIKAVA